jgi:hypothetical protein
LWPLRQKTILVSAQQLVAFPGAKTWLTTDAMNHVQGFATEAKLSPHKTQRHKTFTKLEL